MNILALLSPARLLILAAMVAALTAGYFGWRAHERSVGAAPYIAAINAQKVEAEALLKSETARVEATQKQLELSLVTQEKTDEANKNHVAGLDKRLAALGKRLRDPARRGTGSGSTPGQTAASAPDSSGDASESAGLFSESASDLLRKLAREADAVNLAYASCRADALGLREP